MKKVFGILALVVGIVTAVGGIGIFGWFIKARYITPGKSKIIRDHHTRYFTVK